MSIYNDAFYARRYQNTVVSAERVLAVVQEAVPRIASAVDLGCGVGAWLNVLEGRGASDVFGVDGPWVNKDYLKIAQESFIEHDLSRDVDPGIRRRFDLAISLEVAEHLPTERSPAFVKTLTELSDFVLFSAAIPFQGGQGHINEQWPSFWIELFERCGYQGYDIVRKRLWDDETVNLQYRQNTILYVRKTRSPDLTLPASNRDHLPAEQYSLVFNRAIKPGIKKSLADLRTAMASRFR